MLKTGRVRSDSLEDRH